METICKILSATGIPRCDDDLKKQSGMEVMSCPLKNQIPGMIEEFNPQIVIVSDKLSGEENIIKMILNLKNKYHYIRFIYLAGNINPNDSARIDALGMLVLVGVYDIVLSKTINIDLIMDAIENPKKEQAVKYLTKNLLDMKHEINNTLDGLEYEVYEADTVKDIAFPNLYTFSSVKPGTGKSFLAVNVACAIAKYGKNRPKVALIEADMQTLSVGTLLSIDEKKGNIKNAMESIAPIFDRGTLIEDPERIKKANKVIKNSLVPYKDIPNLEVLVGSSISAEEIDALGIIPEYFTYIIDVIKNDYDYIIVDTNSSIFHVSSFPIMHKAKTCYYILNLDFNNIRNNIRYANILKEIGISNKVKYILNENIENTKEFSYLGIDIEELNFTSADIEDKYFNLVAKIPSIPKTVFLNRLYDGTPVVLDKNSVQHTNKAKLELLKVANEICELNDEFDKLAAIVNGHKEKTKLGFSLFKKDKKIKEQLNGAEDE